MKPVDVASKKCIDSSKKVNNTFPKWKLVIS